MGVLAALTCVIAVLAACGGGGSPATSPYGAPATNAPAVAPAASSPAASPGASGDYEYKEGY